jgi:TPR repeat protein
MSVRINKIALLIILFLFPLFIDAQSDSKPENEESFRIGMELYDKKDYKKAFPYLLQSAEWGNSDSQHIIGRMYNLGEGVDVNYAKAWEWYKKAADQGNLKSYNNMGTMYSIGQGVEKNESEALKCFLKAAEGGIDVAQVNVGNFYRLGRLGEPNLPEAKKWYEKAALQNNTDGQLKLGLLYLEEKNYKEAEKWYLKAAESGNSHAKYCLGSLYEFNYGTFRDLETAARWYREAANQGDASAQYNLGVMYERGRGVKQDLKEAFKLYTEAAEQGKVLAQDNLGWMYENGMGVMKSYSKAAHWYKKAAEKEHPNALNNLGRLYFNGNGVKKDRAEGIWLMRKAAEMGCSMAQSNLGKIYEEGIGVNRNYSEAVEWYKKAIITDPNNAEAYKALTRLGVPIPKATVQDSPKTQVQHPQPQESETGSSIDVSGTGFIIDKRGFLATNYHVTKGARDIFACLQVDGVWKSYHAVVVKNDPTNDLSIIRIDDMEFSQFTSLPYNFTAEVQDVASEIYTLGYPQVQIMGTEVKYTSGTINSKSGIQDDPTHYQISAHIDHGNSGGPMFNIKGQIVGITDSGLNKSEYGDVNYAIKSSYLKSLVDSLPVKLELPHDNSIEKLSRVEQIKILSKYTALILIDLP